MTNCQPAEGGRAENQMARGQKISGEIKTPKNPSIFARSPKYIPYCEKRIFYCTHRKRSS